MTVIDDLVAEQDWLEAILLGLTDAQWLSESAAAGWSIADVVLHLAQSEEGVEASVNGRAAGVWTQAGVPVDDRAARMVELERDAPDAVFARWRKARRAAVAALRAADPGTPVPWVVMPMKPATLATTRLAEHWAHGIDVTTPLGIPQPDTGRLRHIAWLAHRTLPYALTIAGEEPVPVFCELTSPDGSEPWRFGPADAQSRISGPAGAFCRVAARRLAPDQAGLTATGPHGATALRVLRTYAA